jgi:hypothetical protein
MPTHLDAAAAGVLAELAVDGGVRHLAAVEVVEEEEVRELEDPLAAEERGQGVGGGFGVCGSSKALNQWVVGGRRRGRGGREDEAVVCEERDEHRDRRGMERDVNGECDHEDSAEAQLRQTDYYE